MTKYRNHIQIGDTENNKTTIFLNLIRPHPSPTCLIIEKKCTQIPSGIESIEKNYLSTVVDNPQLQNTFTEQRSQIDATFNVHSIQNIILSDDPFEEVFLSDFRYDVLIQFGWCALYIVIFLAFLVLLKRLFIFSLSKWRKRKQKSAVDIQQQSAKNKCTRNNNDEESKHYSGLQMVAVAAGMGAIKTPNDWESESIYDDNYHIDGKVIGERWRSKKQPSFHCKKSAPDYIRMKRACISVGPVMLDLKGYGNDFDFLKYEKEMVAADQQRQEDNKNQQPKMASTYYVCVLTLLFF